MPDEVDTEYRERFDTDDTGTVIINDWEDGL